MEQRNSQLLHFRSRKFMYVVQTQKHKIKEKSIVFTQYNIFIFYETGQVAGGKRLI